MKYSITCSLLPATHLDGTHTVRFRVSWNGRRVTHYLDNPCSTANWNTATSRPKPSQRALTKEINELTATVDQLFERAHLDRLVPTEIDVKMALDDIRPGYCTDSLADVALRFIEENASKRAWEDNTLRNYRVLQRTLSRWNGTMPIGDFRESAMQSFVDFLYRRGDSNPTVKKYLLQLSALLEWCEDQGMLSDTSWKKFSPVLKGEAAGDRDVVYLTEEELQRVIDLDLSADPHLDHVRDVFLFCCFTGIRYSDVAKLQWSDVHDGYIEIITKKTRDRLRIDLNDFSSAILAKYDSVPRRSGPALPVISNQKMNDALKVLGQRACLDEPVRRVRWVKNKRKEEVLPKWQRLTTHCGRKTFIVTALSLEIPAVVIMRWTGHSDYDAMRPYIKIVDKLKASSMEKFNTLLQEGKNEMTEK